MSFMVYAFLDKEILALETREFFDEATQIADQMVEEIGGAGNNWYQNTKWTHPDSGIEVSIVDCKSYS